MNDTAASIFSAFEPDGYETKSGSVHPPSVGGVTYTREGASLWLTFDPPWRVNPKGMLGWLNEKLRADARLTRVKLERDGSGTAYVATDIAGTHAVPL